MTKTIVALTVLVGVSFTAGAQEHELDMNLAERKEEIASCFYKWDCFGLLDMNEENLLVQLIGFKCPEAESGWGSVSLGGRKGSEQLAVFIIHGLDYTWVFGDFQSNNYLFVIKVDGTGLYYDLLNSKEDGSINLSQRFACVERSDETTERMVDIFEDLYAKSLELKKNIQKNDSF